MNYLAHLYFARPTPASMMGNLMGDFVKGDPRGRFPDEVTHGVILHRAIDAFTDRHPVVVEARSLISSERRRFAGIILDVCWDHFLSRHWSCYHDVPLSEFIRDAYRLLSDYPGEVPDSMCRPLRLMVEQNWLAAYGDLDGVSLTLDRIARRLSRPTRLPGAGAELRAQYRPLEEAFLAFFPDLIVFTGRYENAPGA